MELLKPKNKTSGASNTQKFVDVEEIRDGGIVLKSGALRAVIRCVGVSAPTPSAARSEYKTFIRSLTEVSNIMAKFFYVVVPFSPVEDQKSGFFGKMKGLVAPKQAVRLEAGLFETYKNQLFHRVDHIAAGLSGAGLHLTQLNTEEVIELLYNSYNPSLYTTTILKNVENIELSAV